MESGLSLHQSEKSITQALENLSETQVNDFLSGRAPLMLAIRMGENMVFVQLQLSTVTQGQGKQQVQAQANPQLQQNPSVTPMTQRTATLLSQRGLSASALAQATRCLSRRIHHLHGRGTSSTSTSNPMNLNPSQISSTNLPVATPTSSSLSSSIPSTPSQQPPVNATTAKPSTSPMRMAAASGSTITPLSSLPTAHSAMTRGPLSLAPSAVKSPSPGPSMLHLPTSNPLPAQNQPSSSGTLPSPPPSPGAVMNSLKHVGSGIYSGTFSGTLDSSLQEANGQPRRSVNTILHILNDLLVASPASPQPQPMTPTTPTNLSGTTSPSSTSHKNQHHQVFFNPNSMLTPPPSPKQVDTTGFFLVGEKADNELLRGKMQRVQMMLAQKKEQRGKRRQAIAPYSLPKNLNGPSADCLSSFSAGSTTDIANSSLCKSQQLTSAIPASSSASPGTASERPRMCTHVEDGSECCSSYGNKGLEHDSLVV